MQKEILRQIVDRLPANGDVVLDAFIQQVRLLETIEAAESRLANGEGIPHAQAVKRMENRSINSWSGRNGDDRAGWKPTPLTPTNAPV